MPIVAAIKTEEAKYPSTHPFHPHRSFPEYPFGNALSAEPNHAYDGVRALLAELGYDRERFDTTAWNPLSWLVKPGDTVVIKPNFVLSANKGGGSVWSMITHPSVMRAIADYCWIALKGSGRIVFADAPQYDCNHDDLPVITKLPEVCAMYAAQGGVPVEFRDLRPYWSRGKHFASMRVPLPGDPEGNLLVNLGKLSALYGKPHSDKLYGAVYHRSETIEHHTGEKHEYQVSKTMMNADVVISVPKLKVHKKVGVTLNIKGLVGINTNKNYLVHYTLSPPSEGGDQYPEHFLTPLEEFLIKTERWMYDHLLATGSRPLEYLHRSIYWLHNHGTKKLGIKVAEWKRLMDAGNWYGNDSAWRMAVDLATIFFFADKAGQIHGDQQRRMFTIIDGIVGGDNLGPLTPDDALSGTLIGSENFLAADLVASRLMGFDPQKMKMYRWLLNTENFSFGVRSYDDIQVLSPLETWRNCLHDSTDPFLGFKPHPGWVGHLEIDTNKIKKIVS